MSAFVTGAAVRLADFSRMCAQRTSAEDYPLCAEVVSNVPIYQARTLRNSERLRVMNELHRLFRDGPGVMVVRQAYEDLEVVDRHSQVFEAIFAHEAAQGVAADHFAKAGSNGRIWNSLQKAALQSPESFAEYYANPLLGLIAEAWLGPSFQMTAQVNVVNPGGQAQQPHRDYHLGFQTHEVVERFPLPLHLLSQYLTLQGAVAHSDMPLESGPTLLLPFSQQYPLGYLAWRRAEFIDYFQLRLPPPGAVPLLQGTLRLGTTATRRLRQHLRLPERRQRLRQDTARADRPGTRLRDRLPAGRSQPEPGQPLGPQHVAPGDLRARTPAWAGLPAGPGPAPGVVLPRVCR